MKKIIFLAIFAISFIGISCFAQDDHELNYVNLSPAENARYLDSLESAWVKIRKLPEGKNLGNSWSYGNYIAGTRGKIINRQKYILTIDNKSQWDDGSIVSEMTFYIISNNARTYYFPRETITFYYNHTKNTGMAVYTTTYSRDDEKLHEKSAKEIRQKINELIINFDHFF